MRIVEEIIAELLGDKDEVAVSNMVLRKTIKKHTGLDERTIRKYQLEISSRRNVKRSESGLIIRKV